LAMLAHGGSSCVVMRHAALRLVLAPYATFAVLRWCGWAGG
jgi:hypothetical protein